MAKINGTDLLVYVGSVPIAHSTSCTLNIVQDLPDATTKDSGGWADHINGLKSWSIDADALVDYSGSYGTEELFDNLSDGDNLTVKFSTEASGDSYWSGTVSVASLPITADMESPVSYSVSFTGKGALSRTTV